MSPEGVTTKASPPEDGKAFGTDYFVLVAVERFVVADFAAVAFLVVPVLPWLAYGFWRIKRSRL